MADLSQTITNSLVVFGPAPSDKWNASYAVWNAFKWGEGTIDLTVSALKVLSETLSLADSLSKVMDFNVTTANQLATTSDMILEQLGNGDYSRLFPGGVTNGESRIETSWGAGSSTTPSWSSGTASSTSWSQS